MSLVLPFTDAVRAFRAGRVTTLLAVLVASLVLSAGILIFAVVDAVVLRPLPYGAPDRLVGISLPSATAGRVMPATPKDFYALAERTRAFEGVAAGRASTNFQVTREGGPESFRARAVSANLFDVLQVTAQVGRLFGARDTPSGRDDLLILSYDTWMTRFAGDPNIAGRLLTTDRGPATVLGVLREGVSYPITLAQPAEIYLLMRDSAADRDNDRSTAMLVVARMRAGVTVEQARADVGRVSGTVVMSLHDQVVGPGQSSMLFILAAASFVLIVAIVNIGSLLLGRAATRAGEFSIRETLGASRRHLVATLTWEGLILSGVATVAALGLSVTLLEVVTALLPPGLARVPDISVNGRVMLTAAAVALFCGALFGAVPSLVLRRSDLHAVMKSGGGPVIGGRRRDRLLVTFLMIDMSVAAGLLVMTTLALTSFWRVSHVDLGFDRRGVYSLWFIHSLRDVPLSDRPSAVAVFRDALLAEVRADPSVTSAALLDSGTPLSGTRQGGSFTIITSGVVTGRDSESFAVTPAYFAAMGISVVRGRSFVDTDRPESPAVMIVNDVVARRYFPDVEPLGQVVRLDQPMTIVGVVKGVLSDGPEVEGRPQVYTPLAQKKYRDMNLPILGGLATVGNLVVRLKPRARLGPSLQERVDRVVGGDPPAFQAIDTDFDRRVAYRRFNAALLAIFGALAVLIAGAGVYGTMAFLVSRQVPAIGLRLALGASPRQILRGVLLQAVTRSLAGAVIGLAFALAASSLFSSLVFGVSPADLTVYGAVGLFLVAVAVAAALIPALRAAHVDPTLSLRRT